MATEDRGPGAGISVRTLTVLVSVLLVSTLAAVLVGLALVHQPPLTPVPVPSVSQL